MDILIINGQSREFADGLPETVAELLKALDIDEATVVAEVEGEIVEKKRFGEVKLASGQSIELVRFVPGG